jgi:hypothetical protein
MKHLFLLAFLLSSTAWASDIDSARIMSVGSGIASPSKTSALLENPAGLSINERTRIMGLVRSDDNSFNPLGFGGGIFAGNGQVGAAGDIERISDSSTMLNLGLGFEVPSTDFSLGVDLHHELQGGGGGWNVDLGAIFNEKGKWRIGAEVFDAFDGGYGAGIATNLSPDVTFATDASVDKNFNGLTAKPGIGVDLHSFQLTYGYGWHIDKKSTSHIFEGHAAGLGIRLTDSAHLQGYYNQMAKYFIGLVFKI